MTQRELALASKVSQSAIGNYESDLRNSSRALLRLAQALAVSPAWLENGQGAMEATATAAGYPMPRHNTPTLRDELTAEQPAQPAEWLFDARDHERYLQLHPENRRFLRQAMRALLDSLHAEQGTPVSTRKSRRPT
ncbi:transcriptional regulator [Orrella dioscoreae]|uniref:Transcriptional regulator n=3 Tax=root TaxID=1 RepID=A0A1C3K2A1_9BURK|nr:transcriptional regulator [Orrella dioscoreae]SOE47056.1 transcriptional regulator [Orrella dioscoreae]